MRAVPARLAGSVFAVGVFAGFVALPLVAQTFQGRVIGGAVLLYAAAWLR